MIQCLENRNLVEQLCNTVPVVYSGSWVPNLLGRINPLTAKL